MSYIFSAACSYAAQSVQVRRVRAVWVEEFAVFTKTVRGNAGVGPCAQDLYVLSRPELPYPPDFQVLGSRGADARRSKYVCFLTLSPVALSLTLSNVYSLLGFQVRSHAVHA